MRNLTATICLTLTLLLGSAGVSFALPPCPEKRHPTTSPWLNCFGTYTFANGNKYVGEFRNDKPNGQGTATYPNGDQYVGEFRNSKKHGQGTFTFVSGNKYVGEYRDDQKHGQGTYTHPDGNKYVGAWRDNKQNGQGTETFEGGDKYVGEYSDGKQNGQGTYTFANGSKYVGEVRNNKKHGQGTYTYANGQIQEGIWKENKFQYAQKVTPTVTASKTLSMVPDLPPPQLVTRTTAMADVQEALQVLDLYSGKLDGIIGPKTRSAIQRWQKRNGYPENGEITEIQIIKLEQEAKSNKSSSLWGDLDWKIRWFICIIIPLIGFSKICIIIIRRRDIHCTWCGSGIKNLKYLNGIAGELFWKYRNNDGSRDKRVKDNYETASFMSKWQCQHCDAVSKYQHYVAQNPSEEAKVWKGELVSPGKEERTATDYNTSKDGEDIDAKSANRKS